MMIIEDDRTVEQRQTLTIAWVGTDPYLSGWGLAEGGVSYAAWAHTPEQTIAVEREIRARGDMHRVRRVTLDSWRPRARGHCHIYVWKG